MKNYDANCENCKYCNVFLREDETEMCASCREDIAPKHAHVTLNSDSRNVRQRLFDREQDRDSGF